MGIRLKGLKYFEEITNVLGYEDFHGLKLCQLGDLFIRRDARNHFNIPHSKAYNYFTDLGFEVTTIDLGIGTERIGPEVLQYDLSKPITEKVDQFDFVLDFGTSEHIDNQYELFQNIYNLCKVEGIIMHSNPSTRYGSEHGLFHYTFDFFVKLSQICKYKMIDIRETSVFYWKHPNKAIHINASLMKTEDDKFPSWDTFNSEILIELAMIDGRERKRNKELGLM